MRVRGVSVGGGGGGGNGFNVVVRSARTNLRSTHNRTIARILRSRWRTFAAPRKCEHTWTRQVRARIIIILHLRNVAAG